MFREVHYGGDALMCAATVSRDWGFLFKMQSSPNSEGDLRNPPKPEMLELPFNVGRQKSLPFVQFLTIY